MGDECCVEVASGWPTRQTEEHFAYQLIAIACSLKCTYTRLIVILMNQANYRSHVLIVSRWQRWYDAIWNENNVCCPMIMYT